MAEPLRAEDILGFRMLSDPQVSPDGGQVAFVVTRMDANDNEQKANLWSVPSDAGRPARQLTFGSRRDSRPRWSPDGRWLAFVSNRDREWSDDLYLIDLGGSEPKRVARLPRGINDYAWRQDSGGFALLGRPAFPDDPDRRPPKDDDEARKRYQERVLHIDRFKFRMDGSGHLDDEARQVWVCDRQGCDLRAITEGPWEVQRPRWTPEGRIAFLSNRSADHDRTDAMDLWSVGPEGGEPTRIDAGPATVSSYGFGPQGRLAAVGNVAPDQAGAGRHLRLWIDGLNVTESRDRTLGDTVLSDTAPAGEPFDPRWADDGRWVYLQASDAGSVSIQRYDTELGSVEPVVAGRRVVPSFSYAGGALAYISTSPDDPVSLRAAAPDGSGERVLFEPNPWVRERALGSLRDLDVEVGGRRIDAWAMLPPGHSDGRVAPTLLYIHGGPHAAYGWSFQFVFQILCGAGYAIVYCNPPGSQSYDEDFALAIHGSWGDGDFDHFMATVDAAVAAGFADPDRLGIGGASYGGYGTLWVISHTNRFKAAVAARPVVNLNSFYGSSDIGWNFAEKQMHQEPWLDGGATYLRLSPLTYLEQIQTPVRLIAGLADLRTPHEQAEQAFIRLRKMNRQVDLVLFHGEPHGVVVQGKPWNRVRHMRAVQEWFDRHLK